tara:strand:+ start:225 stop:773 length:549 start_codon:yes stop_codon:yes gene_type:complete
MTELLTSDKQFRLELLQRYSREKGWVYFGGHEERTGYDKDGFHNIRFHRLWPDHFDKEPFIHHSDYCVCGHIIVQQCYIYNRYTKKFEVVGNCCIHKWKLQGMPCSMCFEPHLNRKDNYCNDCRIIIKKQEEDIKLKEITCIEEGCNNKKKKWNGKLMPRCKSCFFKNKNKHKTVKMGAFSF